MSATFVLGCVLAVGAVMLGIGFVWGREQQPPQPAREVVTSDFTLFEYIQASEELLSRWNYSEATKEVTYKSASGYSLRWRPVGLLTDGFYFDPMREFALEAKRVQLNTPAKRRAISFDYRATMTDEKVGPELWRAMGFLDNAKYDSATGLISGVQERSFEEVMTIYNRAKEAELTRGWERQQKENEARVAKEAKGALQ